GACHLRIWAPLEQLAAADSQRLTAASAERAAASAREAAACACSTSRRLAQPLPMVPTRASIAMLAPNVRAFIPTHLLCPESSRGGLGKTTRLVAQSGDARNQGPDGSVKLAARHAWV